MPRRPRPAFRPAVIALALASVLLGGCDMVGAALGIESPEKVAAARDADGRAIGAACRHAGRAIEDCYALNRKAERAAMFAGWRDMNDYMRENKIDAVAPRLAAQVAAAGAGPVDPVEPRPTADAGKPALPSAETAPPRAHGAAKAHDS